MKTRIRELLRAHPFQPFIIRTADGKEYKIENPEFVLAGSDTPNIYIEEPNGSFHTVSALLVTAVSVLAGA
ncbi:MAG TPA: hypothetical protein VHY22_03975 [Chthoniobacteraceae bacterium]|jgi:hypothetical protein|nr:hypothetical protein [Chthoniobacteraceae bacterium]